MFLLQVPDCLSQKGLINKIFKPFLEREPAIHKPDTEWKLIALGKIKLFVFDFDNRSQFKKNINSLWASGLKQSEQEKYKEKMLLLFT